MLAHLGLFAPVLEKLTSVMIKVAIDSMSAPWPALYTLTPSDSSSNLPLQITLTATILLSTLCYTNAGSKMLKLSSRIENLALVTNDIAKRQEALEQYVLKLICLTETINKKIFPLVSQATAMVTRVNEIEATLTF
ncbi:hypothetical protein DSO57_1005879 [Entomophthora muscae]|uniref:Uncharacterized protein n=1 Tax=Entomophthora muscae TaxID=34485 RepID=A0ACC2RMJ1_9FUNG|nr:hypothetical protein DSO57_1005879 [Entomophthora muscae]